MMEIRSETAFMELRMEGQVPYMRLGESQQTNRTVLCRYLDLDRAHQRVEISRTFPLGPSAGFLLMATAMLGFDGRQELLLPPP